MARINTYDLDDNVSDTDLLLGADGNDNNKTKHFTVASIRNHIIPTGGTAGQVLSVDAQGNLTWIDLP